MSVSILMSAKSSSFSKPDIDCQHIPSPLHSNTTGRSSRQRSFHGLRIKFFLWTLLAIIFYWRYPFTFPLNTFVHRSLDFSYLAPRCAHVPAISASEFLHRQKSLAATLHELNASAYISEPGANTQFFANLSGSSWHLSERPLLLVVSPETVNGEIEAKVSILTPAFEASRAKLLPISARNVSFIEWAEDADPYQVIISSLSTLNDDAKMIMVDGMVRKFIADGIAEATPDSTEVASAPLMIRQLRERKSSAEIDLLKCVNEATLFALREVRKRMYIGIKESEARDMMFAAMSASGLPESGCLVLFGENAALPHGSGTDRALGKNDLALFDCDASLHGYHSDLTRTFALDRSLIPNEHVEIWYIVQAAQQATMYTAYNGTEAQRVDRIARSIIESKGYGKYFTHRLGHGIGLEVHEQPYLRGGSKDVIQTGHTFSNEPGIYIEGKLGVRLEDTFYISETGEPVYLTLGAGGPASSPWMF